MEEVKAQLKGEIETGLKYAEENSLADEFAGQGRPCRVKMPPLNSEAVVVAALRAALRAALLAAVRFRKASGF
eukprot:CAMPEP_0181430688 /NCGR_PEP_ID=MMETSP1110-20121109/17852_1 /TAXON_ID=174948 /ORGANISM="Symbiodinium sp., Strain CCMP421" /LENGTH=72 /DNA_ID=CAMNT_0023554011 /DNA_START=3 /DNA_END=222 /DNA_ORIENTATION=-